jgi:biotin synthase-like enzyme
LVIFEEYDIETEFYASYKNYNPRNKVLEKLLWFLKSYEYKEFCKYCEFS